MKDYIFKRILLTIPTIFGLTVIVFLLVRLLPGDVIDAMSGGEVAIDEGRRQMIMDRLGLNDPIIVQYGNWLKDIFSGDLKSLQKLGEELPINNTADQWSLNLSRRRSQRSEPPENQRPHPNPRRPRKSCHLLRIRSRMPQTMA